MFKQTFPFTPNIFICLEQMKFNLLVYDNYRGTNFFCLGEARNFLSVCDALQRYPHHSPSQRQLIPKTIIGFILFPELMFVLCLFQEQ